MKGIVFGLLAITTITTAGCTASPHMSGIRWGVEFTQPPVLHTGMVTTQTPTGATSAVPPPAAHLVTPTPIIIQQPAPTPIQQAPAQPAPTMPKAQTTGTFRLLHRPTTLPLCELNGQVYQLQPCPSFNAPCTQQE